MNTKTTTVDPAKASLRGRSTVTPRPFLKWAGGKGQLLCDLVPRVKQSKFIGRYHEPFVGGGALLFELKRSSLLPGGATVCDTNPNLVGVWTAVRDDLEALLAALAELEGQNTEEAFYRIRAEVPAGGVARAARIIYLNKTAFNGLYRENSKGGYNVPFGRYTSPTIRDEANLRACSAALAGVEVLNTPFASVLDRAVPGDLVYFDPPYVPLSKTSSFTRYAKDDFREREQRELAEVYAELTRRGVKAILSNSDAPLIGELYGAGVYRFETVMATRRVNRNADGRGAIPEALVCNFDEAGKLLG